MKKHYVDIFSQYINKALKEAQDLDKNYLKS